MYVIHGGFGLYYMCATVLTGMLITQEQIAFVKSNNLFGLLIVFEHDDRWHTSGPIG
jgi:hypothetical protein